jgi:hypothetical protein
MRSLLFALALAAILSVTSLLAVLFRVSPLTAPSQALLAFFGSIFLSVASVGTLLFYGFWKIVPLKLWDEGKILSIALRQGIFLACALVLLILFHLLSILTWWIGILIVMIFVIVELALHS